MIAIILVNWNGHRDTIECLQSLMRLEHSNFIVLVVDNGSTDNSILKIEAWAQATECSRMEGPPWALLPPTPLRRPTIRRLQINENLGDPEPGQIFLVETGANLGFAGANNVGMRLAAGTGHISYCWLLNNDTVVAPDSLDILVATAVSKPWAKLVGARLMYYHQPNIVQGVAGKYFPWKANGCHLGFGLKADELPAVELIEREMTYVMGASMFLPMTTYASVGPMSEHYFLYFEEADWAERLGPGLQQTTALDAVVYHKEGGSIGTDSLSRPSDTSIYYLSINILRFYARWHLPLMPIAFVRLARWGFSYFRRDKAAFNILLMAASDFITGRRRTGKVSAK